MNEHERSLALAAAAIDFPLGHEDAAALTRHLADCPTCAATVSRMREDAAGLAASERMPAPAHVRQAVVRAALDGRSPVRRGVGLRWSFVAAVLALLAVGGTFVAGAVLERLRDQRPAPTDPTTVRRATPEPAPSQDQAFRPTPTAVPEASGWLDLGRVGSAFEGSTIAAVLPRPGGGLVALGRDQRSATPRVWTSDDGAAWTGTDQPDDVFGGRVPTDGALRDGRLWVVGWDIAVTGAQRAIWSSDDGVTWARAGGRSGLLGTEASDLRIVAGPAGLVVWSTDGRAWTSADGQAWDRSDSGATGVTDAAVDDRTSYLVGRDGGRAFVVVATGSTSWSDPSFIPGAADAQVGIERDGAGELLSWVGDTPYTITRARGWVPRDAASPMPSVDDPRDVVGGDGGFAAVDAPSRDGVQRASVGHGTGAWQIEHSDPADRGARSLVAIAPLGDGWYVLTRQGSEYRGWLLAP